MLYVGQVSQWRHSPPSDQAHQVHHRDHPSLPENEIAALKIGQARELLIATKKFNFLLVSSYIYIYSRNLHKFHLMVDKLQAFEMLEILYIVFTNDHQSPTHQWQRTIRWQRSDAEQLEIILRAIRSNIW